MRYSLSVYLGGLLQDGRNHKVKSYVKSVQNRPRNDKSPFGYVDFVFLVRAWAWRNGTLPKNLLGNQIKVLERKLRSRRCHENGVPRKF